MYVYMHEVPVYVYICMYCIYLYMYVNIWICPFFPCQGFLSNVLRHEPQTTLFEVLRCTQFTKEALHHWWAFKYLAAPSTAV